MWRQKLIWEIKYFNWSTSYSIFTATEPNWPNSHVYTGISMFSPIALSTRPIVSLGGDLLGFFFQELLKKPELVQFLARWAGKGTKTWGHINKKCYSMVASKALVSVCLGQLCMLHSLCQDWILKLHFTVVWDFCQWFCKCAAWLWPLFNFMTGFSGRRKGPQWNQIYHSQ